MKYKVKILDKLFEVEIENLDQRPIVATVNGYTYEVYPIEEKPVRSFNREESRDHFPPKENQAATAPAVGQNAPVATLNTVRSPIPGVVTSIEVNLGQEVREGDPLCVIEAMKMKNTIRSPRSGVIKFIPIHIGKHVRHNEILFEFEGS